MDNIERIKPLVRKHDELQFYFEQALQAHKESCKEDARLSIIIYLPNGHRKDFRIEKASTIMVLAKIVEETKKQLYEVEDQINELLIN